MVNFYFFVAILLISLILFIVHRSIMYSKFKRIYVGQKIIVYPECFSLVYKQDVVTYVNTEKDYIKTRGGETFYFDDMLRNNFVLKEDFE